MPERVWRPRLTEIGERLARYTWTTRQPDHSPLPTVPRRLLVVKVFGMGDAVLVRSIIEHLLSRNPEMEVSVLVGPATRELMTLGHNFHTHEYAPRELTLRIGLKRLLELRSYHYEAILNFEQRSRAGTAFLSFAGATSHIGFLSIGDNTKARFLTHGLRFDDNRSMWESFTRLAQLVDPGLSDTLMPIAPRCSAVAQRWAIDWMHRRVVEGRTVALHVGTHGLEFRRWPVERFVQFAERLQKEAKDDVTILLTGSLAEHGLIQRFVQSYLGRVIDASTTASVEQTAALLEHCDLLVSNDTGIMHLGAAMGTPTVGLFGPNSPRHWAPVGPRATYVYETKLECSPCLNLYMNRWPLECANIDKNRCMLDIGVNAVLSAARRVITGSWLGGD
jgi:ADP-heptose:LPS heptosyltransferase